MSKQHENSAKQYFTAREVLESAVKLARTDPRFEAAETDCPLDYDMVCSSVGDDKLQYCDFDVIGYIAYGTSEGIYGDLFLYGSWNEQTAQERSHSKLRVYVLKTLDCGKEAYLAMGTMVNLICFYANEFVRTHLDRFD